MDNVVSPIISKRRTSVLADKTTLALVALSLLALALVAFYFVYKINYRYLDYALSIRAPKIAALMIASFAISIATLAFQNVINNLIVSPSLLGMNALYLLIHTSVVFFIGLGSGIVSNDLAMFFIDLGLMSVVALFVYSYIFKKTNYNILYVLLIGQVLSTCFISLQTTMIRAMDPNDYDVLLKRLVASLAHVNEELILISVLLIAILFVVFRKDIKALNIIALGRDRAINLGVDYDRSVRNLLIFVALLIAVATALIGPISYLGLICTNVARVLFKTFRFSVLAIATTCLSIITMTVALLLSERMFAYVIPISVFITIFGGIYFLYLVSKAQKGSM